ncbi:MAG: hypothetical protein N2688_00190 [Burkholderiaceae bacterium]|nr:hypothetical protein [Burkholderiaceae bacterium]
MAILQESPGEVVSYGTIAHRLWPNLAARPDRLHAAIYAAVQDARAIVGAAAIRNVARVGYRLVPELQRSDGG